LLAIIDYGMGNTKSVANAFELLGEEVEITDDPERIIASKAIILPGVGAFSKGMKNLQEKGLVKILENEIIHKKKPYLGICLGLQFLAEKSFEDGEHDGFGWLKGTVKKIAPQNSQLKVPQMGWNDTKVVKNCRLMNELEEPVFYYLHSYCLEMDHSQTDVITSICDYGGVDIVSTIEHDNIFAVQFHPEKSQTTGLKLLNNFLDTIRN